MEKVKIVQILVAPFNSEYQGIMLGLGSDGVVYRADNDSNNGWHIYFPCVFVTENRKWNGG